VTSRDHPERPFPSCMPPPTALPPPCPPDTPPSKSSHLSSLKLSNLMTPPHLLYLSLPTLFIDVESAETTLKTLRNRLCYHFRRAPRTMESHFSSYALMQLSSPHTHSPSPNTPPNLLLFILDLKSTEKLENERSVTARDRHSCQICDLSRSPSTISQLFA
jgi:hypothetical protein